MGDELTSRADYDSLAAIWMRNKMSQVSGSQTPQWLSAPRWRETRIKDFANDHKAMSLYVSARRKWASPGVGRRAARCPRQSTSLDAAWNGPLGMPCPSSRMDIGRPDRVGWERLSMRLLAWVEFATLELAIPGHPGVP